MELKLVNGNYESGAYGGIKTVSGMEELAQRVIMKLSCRRGQFRPKPDYGSRLYLLTQSERPADRRTAVRQYAAEALADEEGLKLSDTEISAVDCDSLRLRLTFEYTGNEFTVETLI